MIWKTLKKGARQAIAGLGALSLAACSTTPAPRDAGPRPALWKLADEDTTIYLFGTIHLLPAGYKWRTPALEAAIRSSDTLVLETVLGSDPAAAAGAMAKLGRAQGLPPLAERVPPEKREALQKLVAASGAPARAFDRLETWAAALALLTLSFRRIGLTSEVGVEKGLEATYREANKPVTGLETVEQQLGFFDQLSEEGQRTLLLGVLDDPEETKKQFEAMLSAWSRGDTEDIARTFDSEKMMTAELREVLMRRRNAAWADWLQKRMDRPGTVMVAVGAGHLAGRDSVQAMLRAKGLRAKRVQ